MLKNSIRSGERMGLPSGRPAREAFKGGGPGGEFEKRSEKRIFKKEWIPSLAGLKIVEASACYKVRCKLRQKVALVRKKLLRIFGCGTVFSVPHLK